MEIQQNLNKEERLNGKKNRFFTIKNEKQKNKNKTTILLETLSPELGFSVVIKR